MEEFQTGEPLALSRSSLVVGVGGSTALSGGERRRSHYSRFPQRHGQLPRVPIRPLIAVVFKITISKKFLESCAREHVLDFENVCAYVLVYYCSVCVHVCCIFLYLNMCSLYIISIYLSFFLSVYTSLSLSVSLSLPRSSSPSPSLPFPLSLSSSLVFVRVRAWMLSRACYMVCRNGSVETHTLNKLWYALSSSTQSVPHNAHVRNSVPHNAHVRNSVPHNAHVRNSAPHNAHVRNSQRLERSRVRPAEYKCYCMSLTGRVGQVAPNPLLTALFSSRGSQGRAPRVARATKAEGITPLWSLNPITRGLCRTRRETGRKTGALW